MSIDLVRQQFFQWICSLDWDALSKFDKKLLNLFVIHFDEIYPLGTAAGKRATKIGELIQKKHTVVSENKPSMQHTTKTNKKRASKITELNIGPFRGFTLPESFIFDKKYTFLYGLLPPS